MRSGMWFIPIPAMRTPWPPELSKKAVENRSLRDLIQEVSIPLETVAEITDNGPKTVERKVFPGYVLVKMVMTDERGIWCATSAVQPALSALATRPSP